MWRILHITVATTLVTVSHATALPAQEPPMSSEDSSSPTATGVAVPTPPQENAKTLRLTIQMRGGDLTVENVAMEYGRTRSYVSDPDQFRVKLIGFSGRTLGEIRTWDPRAFAAYQDMPDSGSIDPFTLSYETEGDFFVPFVAHLASLGLTNSQGRAFATVDVVNTIREFCLANGSDTECQAWLDTAPPGSKPTP